MTEEVKAVKFCRRCGRRLLTDEARERGYGKICWEKSRTFIEKKPLFDSKMAEKDRKR